MKQKIHHIKEIEKKIEKRKGEIFDKLFKNRFGIMFNNIEDIAKQLKVGTNYAYNIQRGAHKLSRTVITRLRNNAPDYLENDPDFLDLVEDIFLLWKRRDELNKELLKMLSEKQKEMGMTNQEFGQYIGLGYTTWTNLVYGRINFYGDIKNKIYAHILGNMVTIEVKTDGLEKAVEIGLLEPMGNNKYILNLKESEENE